MTKKLVAAGFILLLAVVACGKRGPLEPRLPAPASLTQRTL
jgi:predicted small lipoprotein YifL